MLMESVLVVWDKRELPYNSPPLFFSWFEKHCKGEVQNTMLKPKRICRAFYLMMLSLKINSAIKHQTRAARLCQTIIANQKEEIEKTVGEYQIV